MGYFRLLMSRSSVYWTKIPAKSIYSNKWGVKKQEKHKEGEGVTSLAEKISALWEWTVVRLLLLQTE